MQAESGTDLLLAAALLREGKLVAIPTETVYGLAANALDDRAVLGIYEVKNRPTFNPLIVHTHSLAGAEALVQEFPPVARALAQRFWPGPLTLVLKKQVRVPDLVTAGLDTVAVRVPRHPLTLRLLERLPFPLAAPSANPFGYISPTLPLHVHEQLGDRIAYILDGGACDVGLESTIVGFEQGKPVVYRLGGLGLEDIEEVAGAISVQTVKESQPVAPGMLLSHYAPRTPLILGSIPELLEQFGAEESAVLSFSTSYTGIAPGRMVVLSKKGDLREAASRLFSGLRQLDRLNLRRILAECVPDTGLGKAINDRLRRASAEPSSNNFFQ
jgi:L-threonylcarbamoyladenylate synthase